MATEIVMPKLGMAMENGTVVEWKKEIDEPVHKGDVVVAIRSEKIEFDVDSPTDGILLDIVVPNDGIVPYGTVIGYIGAQDERVDLDQLLIPKKIIPEPATVEKSNQLIKISPVARRLANAKNIDIHMLVGTGPGGRITKEDIEKAVELRDTLLSKQVDAVSISEVKAVQPAWEIAKTLPEEVASTDGVKATPAVPLSNMRKVIAARMKQSLLQTAQLTITMNADVTDVIKLQKEYGSKIRERYDVKLTLTDFVSRAVVLALQSHPQANSTFTEEEIVLHEQVNLGIAVALEAGLIVPVVRRADKLTFIELAMAIKGVSARAKSGKLFGEETSESTFTITNLGGYGVEFFTPILNPPETGIVGVGAVQDRPQYVGDTLERRSILPLSLTFDHRAIDGAPAAEFLSSIKQHLEEPIALLF